MFMGTCLAYDIDESHVYFVDRIQVDNEIIPESEPTINATDDRSVPDMQRDEEQCRSAIFFVFSSARDHSLFII